MTTYYLIEEQYVGPNKKDSTGAWIGDTWHAMHIMTEPGRTNMSHQEKIDGWLGTTNDWCRDAHGAYASLEAARAETHRRGFTEGHKDEDEALDDNYVESWISAEADKEQWDAEDWLQGVTYPARDRSSVSIDTLTITHDTTDDELSAMAEQIEEWAESEGNIVLHGLERTLESWRDWCEKPEDEDN